MFCFKDMFHNNVYQYLKKYRRLETKIQYDNYFTRHQF